MERKISEIAERVEDKFDQFDDLSDIDVSEADCSALYDVRRQTALFVLSAIMHLGAEEMLPALPGEMLEHIGDCEACIHSLVRQNELRLQRCLADGMDGCEEWMETNYLAGIKVDDKAVTMESEEMDLSLKIDGAWKVLYKQIQDYRVTVELLAQSNPVAARFEDLRRCLSAVREDIKGAWRIKILSEVGDLPLLRDARMVKMYDVLWGCAAPADICCNNYVEIFDKLSVSEQRSACFLMVAPQELADFFVCATLLLFMDFVPYSAREWVEAIDGKAKFLRKYFACKAFVKRREEVLDFIFDDGDLPQGSLIPISLFNGVREALTDKGDLSSAKVAIRKQLKA